MKVNITSLILALRHMPSPSYEGEVRVLNVYDGDEIVNRIQLCAVVYNNPMISGKLEWVGNFE